MPALSRPSRALLLGAVLAAIAGGCGGPAADSPPVGKASPGLEVRDARALLLPAAGAVYFTVVNPGPRSDRLVRVETPAAEAAEPHESVAEADGMMRMVPHPDGFEVPARGTLELAPGGKHLMLAGLRRPPDAGGTIHLILHFARAGAVEVEAAVQTR